MLPPEFLSSLNGLPGFDKASFTAAHENPEPVISIRLNPAKNTSFVFPELIQDKVPWASNAFYLSSRPSFTTDPLFQAGAYYVQEASSMFLQQALSQTLDLSKPLKVLDLCAAPGGKSTHIHSLLHPGSLLVSNEVIKTRVNVLNENITKWGASNVVVTNNDPGHFTKLTGFYDVIVVDAPCSGSGLFRKDSAAVKEWSENNVTLCSQRQQRILASVLPSLKQEGILIYSTCSYSRQEDEDIAAWIVNECRMENLQLQTDPAWGITLSEYGNINGYRFYPGKIKGEGFFISIFKKTETEPEISNVVRIANSLQQGSKKEIAIANKWIENKSLDFFLQDKVLTAIPQTLFADINLLKQFLYIKKAGIKLGEIMHEELVPHHELALSTISNHNIPYIKVDKEKALQYLKRMEMKLDTELKGWVLVKYEGLSLGWVKILKNRVNNYYPKDWRILMQ